MAYVPTVWATGDVITAAKLNNMEQGIEDAFVAPEVTAADQGKVLAVDSSGEWDAAAPKEPVILEGEIVTVNGSDYTFTLTSGNVEDLELKPDIYMKATVVLKLSEPGIPLAEILMPLDIHAYYHGLPASYNFSTVVPMNSHIYYASLRYVTAEEAWSADLTAID